MYTCRRATHISKYAPARQYVRKTIIYVYNLDEMA